MKKRIFIALLMASALAITLASCTGGENETTSASGETAVTTENPMAGEFVETDAVYGDEVVLPEE